MVGEMVISKACLLGDNQVDYFIDTHDLLYNIDSLNVLEFSSLYSDVHSHTCHCA